MKKFDISENRLLTRAEVAEIFQVSPSTVTRWAEAGKLPSVKTLGGHRRYEARVVMELAQQLIETQEVHKSQEASMEKIVLDTPAMYGDHHVLEVRRLLLAFPGVEEVYASSCFHAVEVDYDPDKISAEEIKATLKEAGYLDELPVPAETGNPVTQETRHDEHTFFRYATEAPQGVSFNQVIRYNGRSLWPCPGFGVIKQDDLTEVNHG